MKPLQRNESSINILENITKNFKAFCIPETNRDNAFILQFLSSNCNNKLFKKKETPNRISKKALKFPKMKNKEKKKQLENPILL